MLARWETPGSAWRQQKFESLSHTSVSATTEKSAVLELRRHLGEVFRKLAEQKENRIEEGHLLPYRVHMMSAILPKYAVSQVIGFIKGKSAIHLSGCMGRKKNSCGSTSGRTDITHPWWGEMRLFIRAYNLSRKPWKNDWAKSSSGANGHRMVAQLPGSHYRPQPAACSGSQSRAPALARDTSLAAAFIELARTIKGFRPNAVLAEILEEHHVAFVGFGLAEQ